MLCSPCSGNVTKGERTLGKIQVFLFQAPVISVEDFIQWGWKKLGGKLEGPNVLRELASWWAIVK
jgi:hypothetical protein